MSTRVHFAVVFRALRVLLGVMLLGIAVSAQITPSDDAYTDTTKPTTNYGAAVTLGVSGATQATYITFDLSSIPSGYTGSNVAKASLKLYVNTVTTAGSFNVDYVNSSWVEKTITANNAPPPGATIAASVPLAKSQALDYIIIDLTPAAQAWLNGTQPNYGIALVANSSFAATFDSKESKTQSHPPELDIVFAGGGGGGIQGVLTGPGSGLQGGGSSGTLNLSLLTTCANGQVLAWNSSSGWTCTPVSGGGGTVTSVGLSAPSTDFIVTGSPITTSGTLGLGWIVAPDPNNTANAIVKRDSSGNFSAGTINAATGFNFGGKLFAFGSYAKSNAFSGFAGNTAMVAPFNTAVGYQALQSDIGDSAGDGAYNTAVGSGALYTNNDTSGTGTAATLNTAIGAAALYANTTGSNNAATGQAALRSNTTGSNNTATGQSALFSNSTGGNNTASGTWALLSNTTGSSNTASGIHALHSNTTGLNNTASGVTALYYNTTGTNNTAFGYNAGPDQSSTNLNNATAIGANAVVSASNSLVLGGTGSNAVKVGIGTATPAYTLDVQGSGRYTQPITFASGQTFPGAGTVTQVNSGAGLTGGPITSSGTLSISNGGVTNAMLVNPSVTITAGTDLAGGGLVSLGGSTTLSLNTAATDARYAQVAATNTFTANQIINGQMTINYAGNQSALSAISGTGGLGVSGSGTMGVYGAGGGTNSIGVDGTASGTNSTGVEATGGWGVQAWGSQWDGVSGVGVRYGVAGGGPVGVYGTGIGASSTGVYGSGSSFGVQGDGPDGVYGTSSTGNGVFGSSTAPNGNGVVGEADNGGAAYGVWGRSSSGIGVYGSGGGTYGVYGNGATGVRGVSSTFGGVGISGEADGTNGTGVYGYSSGGGFAGSFDGNVFVGGNLQVYGAITAGTKDFKIDHPLDPANKYLVHASVESSEMMNIYTGNVILDASGEAWVTLPDYFEALNSDFRYQLTAIGAPGPNLYIAEKIASNRFKIAGGKPGAEVSWQVTGIRQDAFAKAHPMIAEADKPEGERGKYLHPVENGQPESLGVNAERIAALRKTAPPQRLAPQAVGKQLSK